MKISRSLLLDRLEISLPLIGSWIKCAVFPDWLCKTASHITLQTLLLLSPGPPLSPPTFCSYLRCINMDLSQGFQPLSTLALLSFPVIGLCVCFHVDSHYYCYHGFSCTRFLSWWSSSPFHLIFPSVYLPIPHVPQFPKTWLLFCPCVHRFLLWCFTPRLAYSLFNFSWSASVFWPIDLVSVCVSSRVFVCVPFHSYIYSGIGSVR